MDTTMTTGEIDTGIREIRVWMVTSPEPVIVLGATADAITCTDDGDDNEYVRISVCPVCTYTAGAKARWRRFN